MNDISVITVDGPAGSGKGTLAHRIAMEMGWRMLDSGALYRLVALSALKKHIDLGDEPQLAQLAVQLDAAFIPRDEGKTEIRLDGENVTDAIRTEDCGCAASRVAAHPSVRRALLERQRNFLTPPGLVADGRDMGTVVFNTAPLKIFLTASPEIRAQRRFNQLKEKNIDANLPCLVRDIAERDARDMGRDDAPLKPADDAVIVDTDNMDIDEVVSHVLDIIKERDL
jgi:cytidylate kinase